MVGCGYRLKGLKGVRIALPDEETFKISVGDRQP
jgi:hypothetical protein